MFDLVVDVAALHYAPGPMWFVQVLLLFSLAYVALRAVRPAPQAGDASPLPSHRLLLLAALGTGAAAFALRLAVPVGAEIAHMQIGYFASYVLLFAVGCVASRHRWLERIEWRYVRRWWVTALVAIPLLPVAFLGWHALVRAPVGVAGGWSFDALLYAFWEPFVAT